MADEDEDITIDLRLRDYLTGGAATAAKEMEELADSTRKAARALLLLDKRADKAANSLYRLAAAAAAARGSTANLNQSFTGLNTSMQTNMQTQKNWQRNLTQTQKRTNNLQRSNSILRRSFMMLGRVLRPLIPALAMLSKMLALVGAAAVAGQAATQILAVVGALTTLLSLSALVPVALGGIVAIAATAKMVFGGLGEAIKAAASGDAKALEKATENMGKNAKAFVKELTPALKLYKGMKNEVQGAFIETLGPQVIKALKNVQPSIRSGLKGIAVEFGKLFNQIGTFFSSKKGSKMFSRFFEAGAKLVGVFTKAMLPLLNGLADVIETVQPAWDRFIKSVGNGLTDFGKWMSEISADGTLADWLDTAFLVAKQLWGVLKDLGGIIKGVIDAAGGAGGGASALGAFGAALGEINKWVNSLEGQAALASFFKAIGDIVKAVTPIFKIIAETIGTVLAPAIADLITNFAPGFVTFLQAFASALSDIAPYVGPLAAALGQIFAALAPLMEPLSLLAQIIAQYLTTALQILAPILLTVAQAFGALLVPFLNAALAVIQAVQPYIPILADAFTKLGAQLIPVLLEIGGVFASAFLPYLLKFAQEVLPQLMPLLIQLAIAFGTYLLVALLAILPYLPQIAAFMITVMQNSASLWPILITLAIGFLRLATAAIILITPMLRIIGVMVTVATGVMSAIDTIVDGAARLIDGFISIPGRIAGALVNIAETIAAPFRRGLEIVQGIIGQIADAASRAGSVASSVGRAINPFRFAGGPVERGQAYTVGEIGKELFIGNNGNTKIIGQNGMDPNWTAPSDGMILPSSVLKAMSHAEQRMAEAIENEARTSVSRRDLAAIAAASAGETHHWNLGGIVIQGDVREEVDIERAIYRAVDKLERDRKERK